MFAYKEPENPVNSTQWLDIANNEKSPRPVRMLPRNSRRKRLFTRELRYMMYGFGDVANPLPETVDLLDDLVTRFIVEMTTQAERVSPKRGRIRTEDIVFTVRKDAKKYARVVELLQMNEELKKARRVFELDEFDRLASTGKGKTPMEESGSSERGSKGLPGPFLNPSAPGDKNDLLIGLFEDSEELTNLPDDEP